MGVTKTYTYDANRRLQSVTKLKADGTTAAYTIEYTYDAYGRRLSATRSANGITPLVSSNSYDMIGRKKQQIAEDGTVTSWDYNDATHVVTETRPGGGTRITINYADGQLYIVEGTAVLYECYGYGIFGYDNEGYFLETVKDNGARTEITLRDMTGKIRATLKPGVNGSTLHEDFRYNGKGQLQKKEVIELGSSTTSTVSTVIYSYDALGRVERQGQDANGDGSLTLDSMDRISDTVRSYVKDNGEWYEQQMEILYPYDNSAAALTNTVLRNKLTGLGGETTGLGLLTLEQTASDRFGNETVQSRYVDRANRTVTQTVNIPTSTQDVIQVSINGLLDEKTDDKGQTTEFEYDALERRTAVRSKSDNDARETATVTHYNDKNQIAWTMDAASNKTWYAYDPDSGRKAAETNALNETTLYEYNDRGQVTTVGGSSQYPVQYDYDDYGRMTDLYTMRSTNGWDHTQWKYDLATGVMTNKLYDDGKGPSYSYTPDGKLQTRTWARTEGGSPLTTTYSYDALGSLTNMVYSDGTTPSVSIAYNRLGQKTQVIDASGTNTFDYSDTLLLTNEFNVGQASSLSRQYDDLGRASGITYGDDYAISYGYDTYGRFASVTSSVPGTADTVFDYDYLQGSQLISGYTATPGGSAASLTVSYGFEDHRDVKTLVDNQFGTSLVSSFDYTYDELMRRTQRIDTRGAGIPACVTNDFDYNARSELTDADMGADVYDYNYDLIGNRIQMTEDGSQTTDYSANSLNQYSQITNNQSQITLSYDSDGNLTNDSVNVYTWNAENRLIAVEPLSPTNGATKCEFAYDAYGRRISKDVYVYDSSQSLWSKVKSHAFVYDAWNLIADIELNPQSEIVDRKCFVWGLDLSGSLQGAGGVGGLLSQTTINSTTTNCCFAAYDANGNVAEYVTTNGTAAAHFEYDSYGNITKALGLTPNTFAFRFSTKYWDAETQLSYYGFRYYNPENGRWLNRDPIGEGAGLNLYEMVNNDPIGFVDILGLCDLSSLPDNAKKAMCCALKDQLDDPRMRERSGELYEESRGDDVHNRPKSGPRIGPDPEFDEDGNFIEARTQNPPIPSTLNTWQIWGFAGAPLNYLYHTHPDVYPDKDEPPSDADKIAGKFDSENLGATDIVLTKDSVYCWDKTSGKFKNLGSPDSVLGCDKVCCDK